MTNRHSIGGNSPPPAEAFALAIEDLFALVSGSTASPVATDAQEAGLDELLDQVRQMKADAEAKCEEKYRPHKTAADNVKSAWKPNLSRLDAGAKAIKDALTPYRTAKQRAKDAEAAKAREEAAAKLAEAQKALQASDDLEERFAAEAKLKQAAKLERAANRIDRAPTGLRTVWSATITDRRAALKHYLTTQPQAFEALLQELADRDARGTRAPVPGVEFIEGRVAI